ncbi:hypothetical protein HGA91_05240 [candidate division WWE3 bacterium]|nr:hypothetical protein [candidate division WWE3 bacterium]
MDSIGPKLFVIILLGSFFFSLAVLYRSYVFPNELVDVVPTPTIAPSNVPIQTITEQPAVLAEQSGLPNSLSIDYETPGNAVVIDRVSLAQNGFVAIFTDDNGTPGQDIGHSDLLAGSQEQVVVYVNQSLTPGTKLWALVIGDDGDGAYGYPGTDLILTDVDNAAIQVLFEVRPE